MTAVRLDVNGLPKNGPDEFGRYFRDVTDDLAFDEGRHFAEYAIYV
jgi:hypothetical protein